MPQNKPLEFAANIKEMREFVTQKALDLTAVLRLDVATARRVLANHVQKLALTPKETPDGGVLEVSGDVDLFGGDDRVMHVVARDGFGLNYTHGFPLATMLIPRPETGVPPL